MSTMAKITLDAAERIEQLEIAIEEEREAKNGIHTAAAEIIDAQAEELVSLRSDLRQARDLLAGFRPMAERELHIAIDDVKKTYTVQRRFVREYGTFDSFKEAVARRESIRRIICALPFGGELSIDQEGALESAQGD